MKIYNVELQRNLQEGESDILNKRYITAFHLDINDNISLSLLLQYLEEEDYPSLLQTIANYRRTGKIASIRKNLKQNELWLMRID